MTDQRRDDSVSAPVGVSVTGRSKTLVVIYDNDSMFAQPLAKELEASGYGVEHLDADLPTALGRLESLAAGSLPWLAVIDLLMVEPDLMFGSAWEMANTAAECFLRDGNLPDDWSFLDRQLTYLWGYVLLRCFAASHRDWARHLMVVSGHPCERAGMRLAELGTPVLAKGLGVLGRTLQRVNELDRALREPCTTQDEGPA